jgi:3-oxoacyl-[acyl-carrier protein] reductase
MAVLDDRVALVTGASRGIGRAIALGFAGEGAHVALVARSAERLREVALEIGAAGREALALAADVGKEDDVAGAARAALDRFGRIDVLVNNAGIIHPPVALVDFDPALWRRVIEVNLIGAALMTRAVLPAMTAARRGKVINIASIGGRKGAAGRSAYRASKAALISLTESVAAEAHPYGVDVNCICPGGVDTEGYREAFASLGRADDPALMDGDEIAKLAIFLASDASSAVTGTAIDAFGGTNPLFRTG